MTIKKWPYEGDAPVARARKVALAYRNSTIICEQVLKDLKEALTLIDLRLIEYDNPAAVDMITKGLKAIAAAQTVDELDRRFTDWGETWHCPRPTTYDNDDYVDAKTAGELLQLAAGTINKFRVHHKLAGIWNPRLGHHGAWMYRVGDLYELSVKRRPRGQHLKDRGGKQQAG